MTPLPVNFNGSGGKSTLESSHIHCLDMVPLFLHRACRGLFLFQHGVPSSRSAGINGVSLDILISSVFIGTGA